MFKALLKKQMMEINTWLIQNKKTGKRRSKGGLVAFLALYILLFGFVGCAFFFVAQTLCAPLYESELGWLYFALMSLLSVVMGAFGSVFNTYATLYHAKDNELLLSMPILPSQILITRIIGVFLWSFVYTALVFIPAMIAYLMYAKFTVAALVCEVLLLLALSVFVLVLSCILGWVVAKISVRLKRKSFAAVFASIAFIVLYYFAYFKAMELMQQFLDNALTVGATIKGKILPLYWLGCAGAGDYLPLLGVIGAVALMLAATMLVMSRSFIRMATSNRGERKRAYREAHTKCRSIDAALLTKERRRFTSSSTYMINCALGSLFLPVMGVAALIKMRTLREFLSMGDEVTGYVLLIACALLCLVASINDISAPSVSLEGRNLWLMQSLPVRPWSVLKAKLRLHLRITEIPVLFCAVCVCVALGFGAVETVLCLVLPTLFAWAMAEIGLLLNLLLPNLTWTNEIVPIKQSASVGIALFGGWGLVGVFVGLYFLFGKYLTAEVFLAVCAAILLGICGGVLIWLMRKGAKIFRALS